MIPTKKETESANRFHAYRHGWRDAVRYAYKDEAFDRHATLAEYYRQGWADSTVAFSGAMKKAMALYEYEPSILRDTSPSAKTEGER